MSCWIKKPGIKAAARRATVFLAWSMPKSDAQLDLPIIYNLAPIQFAKTATDQQSVCGIFSIRDHEP